MAGGITSHLATMQNFERKTIMPVAKNMKELEKIVVGEFKKRIPGVTKDFCHKWYISKLQMKDIISEEEFIDMVMESLKVSFVNGNINTEFELFKNKNLKDNDMKTIATLWESFKEEYLKHIKSKMFK